MPSRSSTIAGIVSARTRLPASACAAAIGVVCNSSSSSSTPNERISAASADRECVVLLVTNRSVWPGSRSFAIALAPPRIGCPDTCSTPSTSRRMAAMERESRSNGPTGKAGGASNRHRKRRLRVTRSVSIPRSEIELRFSRSSGPGGQHAQKSDTRVEATFDVEASPSLTAAQKRRVLARAGPVIRAIAQDERSQWRNRELATERLVEALREALKVPRRRRPTRPTKAAVERRLEQKRRRSELKRRRRGLD